jgi:hypothetical protein
MSSEHQVVLARENNFLVEIWVCCVFPHNLMRRLIPKHKVWYGVGLLTIFTRMGVRLRTVGWRSLAGDDYLALMVNPHCLCSDKFANSEKSLLLYTADAFLVHICCKIKPETTRNRIRRSN